MLFKSPGQYIFDSYRDDFLNQQRSLWLNLGLWREASRYSAACVDLARMVAEAAELKASDTVVDAGCGFCEPARYWLRYWAPALIYCLNNNSFQVDVARWRIADAGLSNRIKVKECDAVRIPLEDSSADRVIALESAFHFNTRAIFMRDALRVLKPGGGLVMADLLPIQSVTEQNEYHQMIRRHGNIPEANMYDRLTLQNIASDMGYTGVETVSLRDQVFPGAAKLVWQMHGGRLQPDECPVYLTDSERRDCSGVEWWENSNGIGDFVLLSARKPL